MKPEYKAFYKKSKELFKDEPTGHDFSHIKRVLKYAKQIQKHEGGDEFVLFVAVMFHDLHRVLSTKEKYVSAQEAMPYVKEILSQFEIEDSKLKQILFLIQNHDEKENNDNTNKELTILQDSDILDALGKVGLRRTLKYCKNRNIPVYDGNPLDIKDFLPNIKPYSTTHYVHRTMIPEMKLIKTKTGKQLADKQERILKKFVERNLKKFNQHKKRSRI